jgi:hypothetical protein
MYASVLYYLNVPILISKKYMYLKTFFVQKYPLLIWLCIHFLQPSLEVEDSSVKESEDGEGATIGDLFILASGHLSSSSTLKR